MIEILKKYIESLESERDEIIRAMDVRENTSADTFRYIGRLANLSEVISNLEVILENEGGAITWESYE